MLFYLGAGLMAAGVAVVLAGVVIRFCAIAGLGMDRLDGVHKFHVHSTPRLGGVPIFLTILTLSTIAALRETLPAVQWLALMGGAALIWSVGVAEDLTQKTGVFARTLFTAVGAVFASVLAGITLTRLDIPFVDEWLALSPTLVLCLTVVAVLGITHSVNLIDGYNGLLGFYALMVFSALGFVAWLVDDVAILGLSVITVGAIVGFLFWNYPRARIFLGDSGAYLLGFLQAEVSILLVVRNPEVSAWFPMVLAIYPVTETFFSIYRKRLLRGTSPWQPDRLHFHMLVYQRLVRVEGGSREPEALTMRNYRTTPYLMALTALCVLPALLAWSHTGFLVGLCALFVVTYVGLYWRLVRFSAPKRLITRIEAEPEPETSKVSATQEN